MRIFPENLFEKLGFSAIRKQLSGYALSDQAKEWILDMKPASDPALVKQQLELTAELMQLMAADEDLPIESLPDIRTAYPQASIEGNVLQLRYFLLILQVLKASRLCKQFVDKRDEGLPNLMQLVASLQPLKDLESDIERIITKEGEVRSDASTNLVKIRRSLNQRRSELRNIVNRIMRKAKQDGMSEEGEVTLRDGRMVIPVKAEYKRKISGFIHDTSSTGQTVYLEPVEALHVNNDIRSLELEERKEIERILRQLTSKVRLAIEPLKLNYEVLCEVDVIRAKARYGKNYEANVCFPSKSSSIQLYEGLNPHLQLKNLKKVPKEQESIVPLSLSMEADEGALIITGPNAGGKSVAMKTIGLMSCMLQSGMALPAREDSRLPIFDKLFVDLGDNQSIENDLSTFSSRLQWMKSCADFAGKNSLVLIDEAGAGTDPDEGSALYQSLAEELLDRGAKVFITTHHSALKVFAEEHPKAVNGSMEFSQERLEPTYRFRKNVPGSSYGFEIARRMELPLGLIERAKSLLGSGKSKVEHLIVSLEQKEQEASDLKLEYDQLVKKINKQKSDYETKLKSIQKKGDQIKEKALVEAKRIVDHANQRVEKAVEEALRVARSKEEAQKARKGIKKLKTKIGTQLEQIDERKRQDLKEGHEAPKEGDRVQLVDSLTFGELVEVKGKQAVVMANGLRLKTKYDNLIRVQQQSSVKQTGKKKGYTLMVADADPEPTMVSLRLDLRGERGDTAIYALEQYLDRVIQSGMEQVEIVHGKGNGILRKLVHDKLKDEKLVKHFELAPEDQGGAGCTIVYLG